ncbi:MAG: sulfotransferase domain-containing protein, partial [Bdellovibrionales bacterium]
FDKGIQSYTSHFNPQKDHALVTEISTTSFDHKQAPKRVFDVFGKNIKLICPLRNPIVRSYSLYLHYLRYGMVSGSLAEACRQNPQILESSHYADNLQNWIEYFDIENINLVFQEDLERDQDGFIKQICALIGRPYIPAPDALKERYNVTTYSKSGAIAGFAQRTADWLRKNRLYFIINFAKALGLKQLIFGKETPDANKTAIPEDDLAFLTEQLGAEIKKLEKLLGHPITAWQ